MKYKKMQNLESKSKNDFDLPAILLTEQKLTFLNVLKTDSEFDY